MPYVIVTADCSNSRHYVEYIEVMPCGQVGDLDMGGGYPAYRCRHCGALRGSAGMPKRCYDLMKEQETTNG